MYADAVSEPRDRLPCGLQGFQGISRTVVVTVVRGDRRDFGGIALEKSVIITRSGFDKSSLLGKDSRNLTPSMERAKSTSHLGKTHQAERAGTAAEPRCNRFHPDVHARDACKPFGDTSMPSIDDAATHGEV